MFKRIPLYTLYKLVRSDSKYNWDIFRLAIFPSILIKFEFTSSFVIIVAFLVLKIQSKPTSQAENKLHKIIIKYI